MFCFLVAFTSLIFHCVSQCSVFLVFILCSLHYPRVSSIQLFFIFIDLSVLRTTVKWTCILLSYSWVWVVGLSSAYHHHNVSQLQQFQHHCGPRINVCFFSLSGETLTWIHTSLRCPSVSWHSSSVSWSCSCSSSIVCSDIFFSSKIYLCCTLEESNALNSVLGKFLHLF